MYPYWNTHYVYDDTGHIKITLDMQTKMFAIRAFYLTNDYYEYEWI